MNRQLFKAYLLIVSVLTVGCGTSPVFPTDVTRDIDRTLSFASLKEHGTEAAGKTIELGGQIVGSMFEGQQTRVLVRTLPIRTHPVYGPVETGRFEGMFVVIFAGTLTAQDLQHGNMVVVVGTVLGNQADMVTGISVVRPTVEAHCLHIWRTGGAGIDDFPWPAFMQGYAALVEQTYCIDRPNVLLQTS